jgi:hypothetical protein
MSRKQANIHYIYKTANLIIKKFYVEMHTGRNSQERI